jgi:hypothetical protein
VQRVRVRAVSAQLKCAGLSLGCESVCLRGAVNRQRPAVAMGFRLEACGFSEQKAQRAPCFEKKRFEFGVSARDWHGYCVVGQRQLS